MNIQVRELSILAKYAKTQILNKNGINILWKCQTDSNATLERMSISKVIDRHLKHANLMHTEAWPIGSFGFTTIEDNLNIHEDPYVIMHQAVKCFGRFSNLLRHIKMCYFYNNLHGVYRFSSFC